MPAVSLLNLHEDVRCKPSAWVPVGWIPKYDRKLAEAAGRPDYGMDSHASRKVDLFHQCFRLLLKELVGQEGLMDIAWGDGRSSGAAGSEASGRHSGGIRPPYPGRRL